MYWHFFISFSFSHFYIKNKILLKKNKDKLMCSVINDLKKVFTATTETLKPITSEVVEVEEPEKDVEVKKSEESSSKA